MQTGIPERNRSCTSEEGGSARYANRVTSPHSHAFSIASRFFPENANEEPLLRVFLLRTDQNFRIQSDFRKPERWEMPIQGLENCNFAKLSGS